MGGRGASSGIKVKTSKDGTLIEGKPRIIKSYFRESRGFSPGYHGDEIL